MPRHLKSELSERLMIRMSREELQALVLFCQERGLVLSEYVRGSLAACMKLQRQQEKWARDRAAADRLAADLAGAPAVERALSRASDRLDADLARATAVERTLSSAPPVRTCDAQAAGTSA